MWLSGGNDRLLMPERLGSLCVQSGSLQQEFSTTTNWVHRSGCGVLTGCLSTENLQTTSTSFYFCGSITTCLGVTCRFDKQV